MDIIILFRIIFNRLMNDIKNNIITNIKGHQMATIGGFVIYPLIALVTKHPKIALFSIPCMSIHINAIYDLHKMYGSVIYSENKFQHNKYFEIKNNKPIFYKDNGLLRMEIKPLEYNKSKISNPFLSDETHTMVNDLVGMRKLRFRSILTMTIISTGTLNFTYNVFGIYKPFNMALLIGTFIGNITGFGITNEPITKYTTKLFEHIKKKKDTEFKHFDKKYVYINIYGDIINTNNKPFWRKHVMLN